MGANTSRNAPTRHNSASVSARSCDWSVFGRWLSWLATDWPAFFNRIAIDVLLLPVPLSIELRGVAKELRSRDRARDDGFGHSPLEGQQQRQRTAAGQAAAASAASTAHANGSGRERRYKKP